MSRGNNHNAGGPSGPSVVYTRTRRRSPAEIAELPPVKTKPVEFKGTGPGPWGEWHWEPGETPRTVVYEQEATEGSTEALLDWALVSWARRHFVETVWDFTGGVEPSPRELPTDAEVIAIARAAGLEVD